MNMKIHTKSTGMAKRCKRLQHGAEMQDKLEVALSYAAYPQRGNGEMQQNSMSNKEDLKLC